MHMALNANMVEQLCRWCLKIDSLADTREAARRDFFGCDEPGEVHYEEGAGYPIIGERRFLGWFALTFKLPDGRHPAELAATAILTGSDQTSAIDSIKGSRYILAMVAIIITCSQVEGLSDSLLSGPHWKPKDNHWSEPLKLDT
jgi:hypothetical protein